MVFIDFTLFGGEGAVDVASYPKPVALDLDCKEK